MPCWTVLARNWNCTVGDVYRSTPSSPRALVRFWAEFFVSGGKDAQVCTASGALHRGCTGRPWTLRDGPGLFSGYKRGAPGSGETLRRRAGIPGRPVFCRVPVSSCSGTGGQRSLEPTDIVRKRKFQNCCRGPAGQRADCFGGISSLSRRPPSAGSSLDQTADMVGVQGARLGCQELWLCRGPGVPGTGGGSRSGPALAGSGDLCSGPGGLFRKVRAVAADLGGDPPGGKPESAPRSADSVRFRSGAAGTYRMAANRGGDLSFGFPGFLSECLCRGSSCSRW